MKQLNEIRRMQRLAGILKESFNKGMEDIAMTHSNTEPNTPPGATAGTAPGTELGETLNKDIKVGDILNFKDGEVWRVTKVTHSGVFAKPHDEKTKKHNVSIEIEMSNDYLKNNLK